MSLIDRLIEPINDYISFRDFIFHLSSANHEPLYEVVTYLLHHDLDTLDFYNIDTSYKIIKFAPHEFDTVTEFLKEIQKALSFSHEEWVWVGKESLDELRDQDRRALTDAVSKAMQCFFKKSDVLGFEPLKDLIHIIDTQQNQPEKKEPTQQKLGANQKILITYALFTPDQLVCLIINENPDFIKQDEEYLTHWRMINIALESKELVPLKGTQNIPAQQVKAWLARNNYIYKDFNDNMPADPITQVKELTAQLTDAQATIKQITNDYEKALEKIEAKDQSADSFKMGNPTVAYDEPETIEQFRESLAAANAKIVDLDSQLTQARVDFEQAIINNKALYTTPAINIMNAVITEFWINYHPDQPAPKQSTITKWIIDNFDGISDALALNIDKVCRHSDARSGGKYKR